MTVFACTEIEFHNQPNTAILCYLSSPAVGVSMCLCLQCCAVAAFDHESTPSTTTTLEEWEIPGLEWAELAGAIA